MTGTSLQERLTGCPCGHFYDEDCIRHRPIPAPRACLCSATLGVADRERAARLGIWCGAERCAAQEVGR